MLFQLFFKLFLKYYLLDINRLESCILAGLDFFLLLSLKLGNLEEKIVLSFLIDYWFQNQNVSIFCILVVDYKLTLNLVSIIFSSTFF